MTVANIVQSQLNPNFEGTREAIVQCNINCVYNTCPHAGGRL